VARLLRVLRCAVQRHYGQATATVVTADVPRAAQEVRPQQHHSEESSVTTEIGSNRLAMLAAEIRGGMSGVKAAEQARAKHAVATGRALVEAKSLLKHGRWLPWLKEHCDMSERSAQLYMGLIAGADDVPDEVLTALMSGDRTN
jgi:Protein of unknown function (DUF3102)